MKNTNRTLKATLSMGANGIYYIVTILLGLLNRRCLIYIMGIEYQGVSGLFTSVISILELAELGIGTAIIFHLYRPLAENDIEMIKSIMAFYKKCYTYIVIAFIGILLSFKIDFFVGTTDLKLNMRAVFLLMLADIIGSYTFAYKRSILYADQKNYVVANINTCFTVGYNIIQIIVLYLTRNYYFYLMIKACLRIGANIAVNIIVNRQYPYLKKQSSAPLNNHILQDIALKVKGLLCHKIGTFIVNGTDNIFISKLIDLAAVGVYANYHYVINAVNSLLNQMLDGATGSVGNLLIKSESGHRLDVFKQMNLLNTLLSTAAISIFSAAVDDFISLFFGAQYSLPYFVVAVLVVNMICTNQRRVWGIMKSAAGIQYEDRWVPLYESIINLIMSYLFFRVFGFGGIFIGTLFTHIGVFFYTFPILVGKNLFKMKYQSYIFYMAKLVLFQFVLAFWGFFVGCIVVANKWIAIIVKTFIAGVSSLAAFWIVFHQEAEFKALLERIERLINGIFKTSN